ncbi:uncharacterized protein CIMG_09025 [Coccidioides immitis RS]|uniref:Uncharacterized protein n=2 Tax=Coccidioides immitis TaxID=5501 RepID=A0A0E1S062_COCIM|nr:uncharacterized protein CIMG_09025 [Coccidioides immitis RS]EAS27821.1 hypothetical protein CIMG_09025 [Coccidioides immitis RS]KMP08605.1 hypothetical protein CIRG_08286 [Coccidioides immitis RMSCC 2394]TPX20528.1 hypothetical protein DIZ76_016419 [Coccidioides immitis]
MATPMQPCDESLETLTAMVNQTLIETGRFFRTCGSLQSRTQLKRNFPAVHEQYQSALDDLSEQIFIAKAFLEKDYEAIVLRKSTLRASKPLATTQEEKTKDVQMEDTDEQRRDDVTMKVESKSPAQPTVPTTQPLSTSTPPAPPDSAPDQNLLSTAPPTTADTALALPATAPALQPPSVEEKNPAGAPPEADPESTPANISHIDLTEEMGAPEGPLPLTESELDLGGTFGSLLPGLESYANAGTDEAIIGLPGLESGTAEEANPPKDASNGTSNPANPSTTQTQEAGRTDIPMDDVASAFDDAFIGAADFVGGGDDLLLHGADIGELDDSWFA